MFVQFLPHLLLIVIQLLQNFILLLISLHSYWQADHLCLVGLSCDFGELILQVADVEVSAGRVKRV